MKQNRHIIFILFLTLIVIMLGFGMIIPILPFYIDYLGASGSALGLLMALYATMHFIFAPLWGNLSDRYGRKPILMIGVLGNAIAQLLFGLSTQLWMLYAARALSGMLSAATLPTAMAYIGDTTSAEDRGGGMGMLGAAMGIGMILGPGIGGWLGTRSLSLPFFVAAALSMLTLVFILLSLPESLPAAKRTVDSNHIQGPQFKAMWEALSGPMGFSFFLAFLLSFGLTNFEAIFGLYALERYDYGPQQVGIILVVIGVAAVIVQGLLTGPATKRWGEVTIIRFSLLSSSFGFVLMLQATTFVTVLLTIAFFFLSNALLRPTVSALISRQTTGGQGMAMGLNNSFMSLGRIVGPIWAGSVFDINHSYPYLTGAVIMLISFGASLMWLSQEPVVQEEPISS